MPGARHFGLVLSETWMTAHVRSDSIPGRHYHILRHFRPGTTTGVMAAASEIDGVYYSNRSQEFSRGGSVRRFSDQTGDLNFIGSSGFYGGNAGPTLNAKIGSAAISWDDSGLLALRGDSLGIGHYVYLPWPQGGGKGTVHAHFYFSVCGELFGEKISGIVAFENVWLPPETLWGESPIVQKFQGVWCAFATEWEDGSVQYGHLVDWTGAGSFASIVDQGRYVRSGLQVTDVKYREDGFVARTEFALDDGETWEAVTEGNGALVDQFKMAQRAGENFRAHKGYVAKVGETRNRKRWYSIEEIFPDRLSGRVSKGDTPVQARSEIMF